MSQAAEFLGTGLAAFVLGLVARPLAGTIRDKLKGVKPPPKPRAR